MTLNAERLPRDNADVDDPAAEADPLMISSSCGAGLEGFTVVAAYLEDTEATDREALLILALLATLATLLLLLLPTLITLALLL